MLPFTAFLAACFIAILPPFSSPFYAFFAAFFKPSMSPSLSLPHSLLHAFIGAVLRPFSLPLFTHSSLPTLCLHCHLFTSFITVFFTSSFLIAFFTPSSSPFYRLSPCRFYAFLAVFFLPLSLKQELQTFENFLTTESKEVWEITRSTRLAEKASSKVLSQEENRD